MPWFGVRALAVFLASATGVFAAETATDPNTVPQLPAVRRPDASYVFHNGSELTIDRAGAVVLRRAAEKNAIAIPLLMEGESLLRFLASDTAAPGINARFPTTDAGNHMTFAQVEDRIVAILQDGTVVEIPLSLKGASRDEAGGVFLRVQETRHGGRAYDFVTAEEAGAGRVATYLVRDDGAYLLYSQSREQVERITPEPGGGGVTRFSHAPRALDLERFEIEARFKPGFSAPVFKKDGSAVTDVPTYVDGFTENYNRLASGGLLAVPRNLDAAALDGIRFALQHPETGSAVVTGPPGSGKSTLVEGFVAKALAGEFPEIPRSTRFIGIKASQLSAGTAHVGELETRLQAILELCTLEPCVLIVDELHSLRGTGTYDGEPNDLFQDLKPLLANGRLRIIGTDTDEEFDAAFSGDTALRDRIRKVRKSVPAGTELREIIEGWARERGASFLDSSVVDLVVELSDRFAPTGVQPRLSTQLLGEAIARRRVTEPTNVQPFIRSEILKAAQSLYQLDPERFSRELTAARYLSLRAALDEAIIGNDDYKSDIVRAARKALTGTGSENHPEIRLMVAGPGGAGKTEAVRVYAAHMERTYVRIEMNRYGTGNVEGFRRELAAAIRANPLSVILFDEFEKAHQVVQSALLKVLEEGQFEVEELTGTQGSTSGRRMVRVRANRAQFFATTNAGAEFLRPGAAGSVGFMSSGQSAAVAGSPSVPEDKLREALAAGGISRYVLDRFDFVSPAFPATRESFRAMLESHFRRALSEVSTQSGLGRVAIENQDALLDYLVEKFYVPGVSGRRAVEWAGVFVREMVAEALIRNPTAKAGDVLTIRIDMERVRAQAPSRLARNATDCADLFLSEAAAVRP